MGEFTSLHEKMVESVQVEFYKCIENFPKHRMGGLQNMENCMNEAQLKTKIAGETLAENYKKLYPQFC